MKKTISLILCLAMIMSTMAFSLPALAVLDFTAETTEDYAQSNDPAALSGTKGDNDGKPGYNVITGTKDAYGFEDGYTHGMKTQRDAGVKADPDNAENNVLWLGKQQYVNISLTPGSNAALWYKPLMDGKTFEAARPLHLTFKAKTTNTTGKKLEFISGMDNNDFSAQGGMTGWQSLKAFELTGEWADYSLDTTYEKVTQSSKTFLVCFCVTGVHDGDTYIDDVSIIPDYRVVFYGADGKTVISSEYVSYKNEEYTFSADDHKLPTAGKYLGWKLKGTEDSELITDGAKFALAGEDLAFVAVSDDKIVAAETASGTKNSKFSVTAKAPVTEWTVADDMNGALVKIDSKNENEIKLIAQGYNGALTVTGKGEDFEETVTIHLTGASWRPGANFMTGTSEPVTFENNWEKYTLHTNFKVVDVKGTGNDSEKMIAREANSAAAAGEQTYLGFNVTGFDYSSYDANRPMRVKFDYCGSWQNIWAFFVDGSNNQFYSGKSMDKWATHVKDIIPHKSSNSKYVQFGMLANSHLYIDNLSVTPFYKVTYKDSFGETVSSEYVLPESGVYTVKSDLDETYFAGYALEGTEDVVTEVTLAYVDLVLVPVVKEGVELAEPSAVKTSAGESFDKVDPKYPGVIYVFDEALDADTITSEEIAKLGGSAYEYDAAAKTLTVWSSNYKTVGAKESFKNAVTAIKTVSGKNVIFNATEEIKYASEVANDGKNMIPYGDMDGAYLPFYVRNTTSLELSAKNGWLEATATTDAEDYPHVSFNSTVADGATYKLYATVKSLGTKADSAATSNVFFNVIYAGDVEGDDFHNHGSIDNYHVFKDEAGIAEKSDYVNGADLEAEFKVILDGDADVASAEVSVFSEPNDGHTTGFAIDNFELYRRTDVIYKPSASVKSEGVDAPAIDGAYLSVKGGKPADKAEITVAANPYEAIDSKRAVDGWKSTTDGKIYKAGDKLDLTKVELNVNGEYVLVPNIVAAEGYELIDVTFSGDVKNIPDNLEGGYAVGDEINMADFYAGVTSAIEGKRFNGWSTTGKIEDIVPHNAVLTAEKDLHFTAIVNYDLNFALEDTQKLGSSIRTSGSTFKYEDGYLKAEHKVGDGDDVNLSVDNLAVPAGDVYQVIWWVDPTYYVWSDKTHSGEPTKKTIERGTYFEGLFFSHPGQGDNGQRHIGVTADQTYTTPSGKTLIALPAYSTSSANWDYAKTIKKLRFDPNNMYGNLSYRYIQFVEFPKHEETELNVTGLTAPVAGAVPDTEVSVDSIATVTKITWSPEVEYSFDEQTAYTATVTIASSNKNKQFRKDIKVYIDGVEAEEVTFNDDNSINAKVSFPKTGSYIKFDMAITGPEVISKAGRTTQYSLTFSEKLPLQTATWTVADGCEEYGSVDAETGRVVPYKNCDEFKIIATSDYNKKIKAEFTVKFENQGTTTITYDPNTTDTVKGMPESEVSGMLAQLSDAEPTRKGYAFAGWSTSPESRETVTFITAESDETTVYAVWDKLAFALEFNGDDDWTFGGIQNTSSLTIKNGYLEVVSTGSDIRLSLGKYLEDMGFAIPAAATTDVRLRMSYDGFTQTPQLFVSKLVGSNCINGSIVSGELGTLDDYAVFKFNLSSKAVDGYVKAFWLDPFEKASATARIDYLRFYDKNRVVTFNANTEDEVTLPENISAEVGSSLTISAKATRDGYEFIGWSKSADSVELVSSLYLGDDINLYAVWAKKVDVEDSSNVVLESVSEETLVISAAAKSEVTVTVTTENGTETITGKTDANGKFVADLSGIDGTITNVEIAGTNITDVVEASKEVAEEITSDKKDEGASNKPSSDILINGKDNSGSSGTSGKKWDTTVTDTTKPGTIKPSSGEDDESGSSDKVDIKELMAQEGDILLNFDKDGESDFFPSKSLRRFTLNGTSDSVISFTNQGKASGSNDSPALFTPTFALDADTHRYIVMKAKNSTDSAISVYFNNSSTFAEAKKVTATITTDYSMMVYDMASNADWKGTITALFFSCGANVGDITEIDWILFTNEVPESMDAIAGTKELFPIVNKGEMNFADVKSDDWFYSEVLSAYRLGFVTGTTETTYEPDGQVTVAEAITLAVRLNCSYNGTELPAVADGAEWYKNYVNAAVRNSIIKSTQFDDYNRAATRSEVAAIMYKALPKDYLNAINMFTTIPDVTSKNSAFGAIRTLYNAGVVIGSDGAYNFYPDSNITRAEMAAIVNRMAIPSNRKRVVTAEEIEARKKYYYAEDLDIAELGNCYSKKFTIKNDLATGTGSTGDPIVYLTNVLGQLNGKEITKITVGAKWDFSAQGGTPQIFFTTPTGGWAAERMLKSTKGELKEDGIQEFIFDTSTNAQFASTITALRFDPFDAKDIEFSIAYIVIE